MEEDIAYQLAAVAVGAAIVAAIRLSPGCEPAEFVARVLEAVGCDDGANVDGTKLPVLTAPAVSSLNHRLNIAIGAAWARFFIEYPLAFSLDFFEELQVFRK